MAYAYGDAWLARRETAGVNGVVLLNSAPYAPDPVDTHTYKELGPHPPTEDSASVSPNNVTWDYWADGYGRATGTPQGYKSYEYCYDYNPSGEYIINEFYRITYHDAAGRIQKVTEETKVEWTTPEYI